MIEAAIWFGEAEMTGRKSELVPESTMSRNKNWFQYLDPDKRTSKYFHRGVEDF